MDKAEIPRKPDSEISAWDVAKFAATAVTATSLVLILLGYGVSLALETMFGIPHATLFESSFELIDLASVAVMQSLPAIVEALGKWSTYVDVFKRAISTLVVLFVAWLLFAVLLWWKRSRHVEKPSATDEQPQGKTSFVRQQLLAFAFIVIAPLLSVAGVVFVAGFMTIISIIPAIGLTAATAYINDTVINPEHCNPLVSLEQRRKAEPAKSESERGKFNAQCVRITKDGDPVASGRVVFATSKAIILYRPDGGVSRASLGDSVIEVLAELPPR